MNKENIKGLEIKMFSLNDFRSAIQGYDFEKKQLCERNLEVAHIKYYMGIPNNFLKKPEYYYIVATVQGVSEYDKAPINKAIGMVELEVNPYDKNIIWLKFISVNEEYKNKGIGTKLATQMCEFLSTKKWTIERSSPSSEGNQYISHVIDKLILKYNLPNQNDEKLRQLYKTKKTI